jgi:hypothetical protein
MDRMLFPFRVVLLPGADGALDRRRLKAGTVDAILDWFLEKKYDGMVLPDLALRRLFSMLSRREGRSCLPVVLSCGHLAKSVLGSTRGAFSFQAS